MIKGALALPLTPLVDTEVPDTLISAESLAAKKALQPPAWVPVGEKTSGGGAATLAVTSTIGNCIPICMYIFLQFLKLDTI